MPAKRKSTGGDAPTRTMRAKATTKPVADETKVVPAPKSKKVAANKDFSLDIASHERAFKAVYRELKQAIRDDRHNGYEKQMELQRELVTLFVKLQTEIFHSSIRSGKRLGNMHKAMLVLEKWIQKERGNEFDVRCDWREGTGASWTVDNTDGKENIQRPSGENSNEDVERYGLESRCHERSGRVTRNYGTLLSTSPYEVRKQQTAVWGRVGGGHLCLQGARILEYRRREERTKALIAKMYKNHPSRSGPGPQEDDDYENRNMNGYLIEDEWYADDAEMQNARAVLKKLLNFVYE